MSLKDEKSSVYSNNQDYRDQIYTVIGNIYLNHKDTVEAIKSYKLAIQQSTRGGVEKAAVLVTLGEDDGNYWGSHEIPYENLSKYDRNEVIRIVNDVDESHLGFICPECGNQIIVKEINYIDFPDSFYHFGESEFTKRLETH